MDETIETKSLWNKTADDITVADALKLNAIVLIVTIGAIGALAGGAAAAEKISQKLAQRKADKKAKNNPIAIIKE